MGAILFRLSGISPNRFLYNQVAGAIPPIPAEIPDVTCLVPAAKGPVVWPMFTISSGPWLGVEEPLWKPEEEQNKPRCIPVQLVGRYRYACLPHRNFTPPEYVTELEGIEVGMCQASTASLAPVGAQCSIVQ
jgi:hypothetical protein